MKNQHFSTLDSLRGFAALSVCLYHFTGASLPKLSNHVTNNLFSWGWVGVEVFFVISGFIIPYILIKNEYNIKDFFDFFGKRFIRISPPAYIAMILIILQHFSIDYFHLSENIHVRNLSATQFFYNLTYTIPFTEYRWVSGVFWTLAVEFQYYIFIGIFFNFIFKSFINFIASVVIVSFCYYLPFSDVIQFLHYGSMFMMGFLVSFYIDNRIGRKTFLVLLVIITGIAYFQLDMLSAIFGASSALAIAFIKMKNRIGEFLGKISYSLYLTHILIGITLEGILVKLIHPDTLLIKLIMLVVCIAGAIFLSWIFHKVVEIFFINLANRVFNRSIPAVSPLSVDAVVRR